VKLKPPPTFHVLIAGGVIIALCFFVVLYFGK